MELVGCGKVLSETRDYFRFVDGEDMQRFTFDTRLSQDYDHLYCGVPSVEDIQKHSYVRICIPCAYKQGLIW